MSIMIQWLKRRYDIPTLFCMMGLVALGLFLEDEIAFPLKAPLLHVQDELIQFLPQLAKPGLDVPDRFVVHGIVGQVKDDRAMAFCHQIHHTPDEGPVYFDFTVCQVCQVGHAGSVRGLVRPAPLVAGSAEPAQYGVRSRPILVGCWIAGQSLWSHSVGPKRRGARRRAEPLVQV